LPCAAIPLKLAPNIDRGVAVSLVFALYLACMLAFAGLTVFVLRHPSATGAKLNMAAATLTTALWAMATALGETNDWLAWLQVDFDLGARALEVLRNAAWVLFALRLLIWTTKREAMVAWLGPITGAVGVLLVLPAVADIWIALYPLQVDTAMAQTAVFFTRLATALLGLALIENLARNTAMESFWSIKYLCFGLAGLFGYEFYLFSDALLFRKLDVNLLDARGAVALLMAPLFAIAMRRIPVGDFTLAPSRGMVFHTAVLFAAGLYLLAMGGAGYWIRTFGGSWGQILATVLLVGALLVLVILAASASIRARVKVFLARNLFASRYDYRDEWPRFINTITRDGGGRNLRERVIKAVANIVDSPGGALWQWDDATQRYCLATQWNYGRLKGDEQFDGDLPGFMSERDWVVDLRQRDTMGCPPPPAWLASDPQARLVVPLMHHGQLLGMVVLQHPRAPRPLDWEDWTLLRIVGRQAASYLGEQEATQALNQAREMELFNRRFAFVVHDIKTLIAQLSLLLRNADKHGDNPAFQKEIILSVRESVDAMNRILAQINAERQKDQAQAITDLVPLVRGLVERRQTSGTRLTVESQDPAMPVIGDETRLTAIFGHLVNNAVEAAGENGAVEVRLWRDAERARIEVRDNGPGMAPEFVRDELFRPFKSTKDSGYGIGAFQCRELVRELRGQLTVSSVPGQGTVMRVVLALAEIAAAAHAPEMRASA
jgi:putative PEP-CTERM system histidine kinase